MNKIRKMSQHQLLVLVFLVFSLCALGAAFIVPDRNQVFTGFWKINTSTMKVATNIYDLGGLSGGLLNVGLVGLASTLLYLLPGGKANHISVIAYLLTVGFAFWGINLVNMWFGMVGVLVYTLVKRDPVGKNVNAMLFTTGIAPLFSELLLRYPAEQIRGFTGLGFLMALAAGLIVGIIVPAVLPHSPVMHKGYSVYSAAAVLGFISLFPYPILYKLTGVPLPPGPENLHTASLPLANLFCLVFFGFCIVFGALAGCKPKDYWNLLKDSGYKADFSQKFGTGAAIMNMGVYGLFIVLYYNLIGAEWNAITLGCVFAMLSTCFSGAHPFNVWPIMLGYCGISFLFRWIGGPDYALVINSQPIVIGLCFANALAPFAGRFGWWAGSLSAILHYIIVTCIPSLHGGFLLYNGGFTACLVCYMLAPVLETYFKPREERRALRLQKKAASPSGKVD